MNFGEQTTGTRDEHYNLISVLYHALHGAENCETYVLDAETAGDERLVAFFRETQAMQTEIAERAKELLGTGGGIASEAASGVMPGTTLPGTEAPPEEPEPVDVRGRAAPEVGFPQEGAAASGAAPVEDAQTRRANVQREPNVLEDELGTTAEEVPPTTDVPREPGTTPPLPDEDLVGETGAIEPDDMAEGEGVATPPEAPRNEFPLDAPREAPPQGEERPERRREAPGIDAPREDPPPGEERPGMRGAATSTGTEREESPGEAGRATPEQRTAGQTEESQEEDEKGLVDKIKDALTGREEQDEQRG